MTTKERKKLVVGAIRKLEDQMVRLAYCETDCDKAMLERDAELDNLRLHWQEARTILVSINEEELEAA